jgi:predicted permease
MFWRRRKERDFSEEIQAHLELEKQCLREEGLSEKEADAAAHRAFGNLTSACERFYESRSWWWWEQLKRDVVYAVRVLRRDPGFTTIAILSLALGIGANALVFSVVNALILRPLPVDHPGQIVFVGQGSDPGQSFPNYRDLRDRNQSFTGLAAYRISPVELESAGSPDRAWGYLATGNYFDLLGVRPFMGRFFHQEDDLHAGASPYAVLSYSCWQTRFGSDPGILGKTIRINRQPFTVLGVAGNDFHGTERYFWPEVWVPMMMEEKIEVGNPWLEDRGTTNSWVIGRLKPGVTAAQAEANLNAVAAELSKQYPRDDTGFRIKLSQPGLLGDTAGAPARAFAMGVLGLAALVLLAACANLAGLLTARGADRQREMAIRLSIGASRGRIVRQVLTESLLLSAAGGAAGYSLAMSLARLLSKLKAPLDVPIQFDVNPDWTVFLFASTVALLAGVLFGVAPANHASRTNANAVLKGEQVGWRGQRVPLRDVLVVLQVAFCFVLVSACLLSLRGLQKAMTTHLGFEPQGVATVGFELGLAGYSEEQGRAFQKRALEAVRQSPGVDSAAYSNSVPLSIDQSHISAVSTDVANPRPADTVSSIYYEVSPSYFRTMGIVLLSGREFDWHDDRKSPPVAVVNQAFAKQVLHADHPLGKTFHFGLDGHPIQVIGVVEDGNYETLTEAQQPAAFQSILQRYNTTTTLIVKSSLPPDRMIGQIRRTMSQLDPHLPLYATGSLGQMLGLAFFPIRAAAIALSAFGVLAIMLAATGIHGLVSYAVARRGREIGIRIAIGARPSQVIFLVLGRTLELLAAAAVMGFGLALAVGNVLAGIVYGVSPRDPMVLASVFGAVAVLCLFSCWAPARRALHIDPMAALRHE